MSINSNTLVGPSFTLKNRLLRLFWSIISCIFFKHTPRPFHAWRALILRSFGAQLGQGCHIYPSVRIWAPWNLKMGNQSCLGDDCRVYNQAFITLGHQTIISQNVHLCTGTHAYETPGFPLKAYPINIGSHAWIAADSFIGPGVKIGESCIIGARSVVIKDLPAQFLCVGHPCTPKKPRILSHANSH